jgi:hypothetical protein
VSEVSLASSLAEIERTIGRPRRPIILTAPAKDSASPEAEPAELRRWVGAEARVHALREAAFPDLASYELAILLGDDLDAWLDIFGETEAEDALLEALGTGMHVLAAGAAAEAIGSWAWSPRGDEFVGALGWLPGAILVAGEAATGDWGGALSVLARRRRAYALAIPPGDVVGLGPHGEVRLWGDPAPRLLLGPGWD